ncbi:MAG: GNAT family N-acetyltransferase [Lachnospiraceae bacterium]|nr:GNAT family N-acetyltransferase [Lachnospiraceae bacterium]
MKATIISENDLDKFKDGLPEDFKVHNGIYIGAVDSELSACGIMVLQEHTDSLFIKYLYVEPAYRRLGAASKMISAAHKYAHSKGIDTLTAVYNDLPGEPSLDHTLESAGFKRLDNSSALYTCRFMDLSPIVKKKASGNLEDYHILSKVTDKSFNLLKSRISDIYPAPADKSDYDKDLSFIHYSKNNEPDACVLVSLSETDVRVDFVWNSTGNEQILLTLLRLAFNSAESRIHPKSRISFLGLTEQGRHLINILSEGRAAASGNVITWIYTY